eukprot:Nk52_evm76s1992 gene=Nk52_evmTU76s1992
MPDVCRGFMSIVQRKRRKAVSAEGKRADCDLERLKQDIVGGSLCHLTVDHLEDLKEFIEEEIVCRKLESPQDQCLRRIKYTKEGYCSVERTFVKSASEPKTAAEVCRKLHDLDFEDLGHDILCLSLLASNEIQFYVGAIFVEEVSFCLERAVDVFGKGFCGEWAVELGEYLEHFWEELLASDMGLPLDQRVRKKLLELSLLSSDYFDLPMSSEAKVIFGTDNIPNCSNDVCMEHLLLSETDFQETRV